MTSRRNISAIAAAAALSLLALAGCAEDGEAGTSDGSTTPFPRVATLVAYPALPAGIAEGIFDEVFGADASDMSVDIVNAGPDGYQAVSGGHADIAMGGFNNGSLVGDPDLRIIAVTEQSPETHAVLVAPGSDIATVADLVGRTLGGYSARLPAFLVQMFEHAQVDPSEVNYIQVPNDAGLSALTSDAIDAWYTWDPFFAQAEIQGLAEPIIDGTDFYRNAITMVTTQDYIDNNAESLQKFINAYIKSTAWINENPEGAAEVLVEATSMTPEAAALTIDRRIYDVIAPNEEILAWMKDLMRVELELGIITAEPDYAVVIDPQFIEAANS